MKSWGTPLAIALLSMMAIPLALGRTTYMDSGRLHNDLPDAAVDQRARAMDPLGDSIPRAAYPGGLRLSNGMQFHPSCLELFKDTPAEEIKSALEGLARETTADILRCAERYPELRDPYLAEWISQIRRTIIACVDSGGHFGGKVAYDTERVKTILPKGNEGLTVDIRGHASVIFFSNDHLVRAVRSGKQTQDEAYQARRNAVRILTHEGFHTARADNRPDHNHLEDQKIVTGSCDDNAVLDRVVVLTSLCTGFYMGKDSQGKGATAAEAVLARMSCPGRSCIDLFTKEEEEHEKLPKSWSMELTMDKATTLCERLREDGYCLKLRRTTPMSDYEPKLEAFRERLAQRLEPFTPRAPGIIPARALELAPDLAQKLRDLRKSSPCVATTLTESADGGMALSGFVGAHSGKRPGYWTKAYSDMPPVKTSESISGIHAVIQEELDYQPAKKPFGASRCEDSTPDGSGSLKELGEASALIAQLAQRFSQAEKSPIMKAMAFRSRGYGESPHVESAITAVEPETRAVIERILDPGGAELLTQYQKAIKQYHPDSKYFECSSSSPFRASETLVQTLEELRREPKRSCP